MKIQVQRKPNNGYCLINRDGHEFVTANLFLEALHTRGLSPYTLRAYGYDLVALYRWMAIAELIVVNLNGSHLFNFIRARQQINAHPRSINRMLMTVRSFYRFSTGKEIEYGSGTSLPAPHYRGRGRDRSLGLHGVGAPQNRLLQIKIPQTLVEPLTIVQVRQLLAQCSRHRELCIVYLMLFCGLRSQEVINLEMSDLCFIECSIRFTGKGNKQRMLPLPTMVHAAIKRYLQLERPQHCQSDAIFVVLQGNRRGEKMSPEGIRNLFRYRRRKSGLQNANAHRLRHTFGADMARSGTTLPVLQRLMGHSDTRITLQYINLSMADIAQEFFRASQTICERYHKE